MSIQYVKISGVDDMVLLSKVTDDAIVENLRKRYMDDYIFTCIGPVLVSVNPFKQMSYFGEKEIQIYQGAAPYENPPHIYGLADEMYRNMLIDVESQCVIITGESGAGKTVAAKYIMSYISKVSGGGQKVQKIKDIIMESNPLLEAFGNAKTIRNNNSSRFGKYVQIQFGDGGQPLGCKISNFLLEKSRVVQHSSEERNFHIFYQLIAGADEQFKSTFRLKNELNQCDYLKTSDYGSSNNDAKDFQETLKALTLMDFRGVDTSSIFQIVAGILHIGNIKFRENGNYSEVADEKIINFVASIFGINPTKLAQKLTSRDFQSKWGSTSENVDVTLNVSQALTTRDALAKDIYARLFDYLVKQINLIMEVKSDSLEIGILDIYGFEIFEKNSFEQFCINYVNEKLQQIFIELTLKAEQDEYVAENIKWTPIDYFNNAIVVDLLEGKKLPGLFLVLDDICATLHGGINNADSGLKKKLTSVAKNHKHFEETRDGFVIAHYAGLVIYNVDGFCDKNRDVLFTDLIELMQTSSNKLIKALYPIETNTLSSSSSSQNNVKTFKSNRPTTAGSKIRNQASRLVSHLTKCTPHYIRCIKPNELKKSHNWDSLRVKHQVEYLGLKENIRVRRAGFVYRRLFTKFLHRYAILTKQTWPSWQGDEKEGIQWIMANNNITENQYQLGLTKIFIKAPETLFMLEEARDRRYNYYARVIQKAFKKYFMKKRQLNEIQLASDLLYGYKQRRQQSLNRNYYGDYIGIDIRPGIVILFERREKILFAETVKKYDRRFKVTRRDLILTDKYLYLIGRSNVNDSNKTTTTATTMWKRKIQQPINNDDKNNKNKFKKCEVIKRKLTVDDISHISMSTLQDDFIIIHVKDDYATLLQVIFKTEFLYQLNKKYIQCKGHTLNIKYNNNLEFKVKKEGWGGGGTRQVLFNQIQCGNEEIIKINGKTLNVNIGPGLSATTRPNKSNDFHLNQRQENLKNSTARNYANTRDILINTILNNVNNVNNRGVPPPPSHPAPINQPIIRPFYQQTTATTITTNSNFNNNVNNKLKVAPRKPPPPPVAKFKKVKALYSYNPQDLDELELKENDIIEVLKEYDGGWWYGRLKGKTGLFPSNYVETI